MAPIRERLLADRTKTYQVQIRLRGKKPIAATFRRKTDATKCYSKQRVLLERDDSSRHQNQKEKQSLK